MYTIMLKPLISLLFVSIIVPQQEFEAYTDQIPNSNITFDMVAIPGGSYTLGSSPNDKNAKADEMPNKVIQVESFWMGAMEVSFEEFDIYINMDKDLDQDGNPRVEGVVRPSPPYEDPSHNMGGPGYPAVGMTQLGALQYCKWLSDKNRKTFIGYPRK